MDSKSGADHSEKLSQLNKKILEVKKKIQLTEGQRKALFEDCEAERKFNSEQITKLKKEISQLLQTSQEHKTPISSCRINNKAIERLIGPIKEKSCDEVQHLLDLQIIDKRKKIDLLRYRTRKRRKYLAELAAQFHNLLDKQEIKELQKKVEEPVTKATSDLQNNIHAVDVQIREALHVKNRYTYIQKSLREGSDNFESNMKKLEDELDAQKLDIEKLQKIMMEASHMRGLARTKLLAEEKDMNAEAQKREVEAAEGRRLLAERKAELERLEKKIFQGGKLPARPEPEGAEEGVADDDKSPIPPHPVETMAAAFEVLKKATGGTSTEKVLQRFKSQKETEERLSLLRRKSEDEKQRLEKKMEILTSKLDSYKYAEVKEAESKTGEMERMQKKIEKNIERSHKDREEKEKKDQALKAVLNGLQNLHLCINPLAIPINNGLVAIKQIDADLKDVLNKIGGTRVPPELIEMLSVDAYEDKWLPVPYSGLLRRTPIPQASGTSPAPPAPLGSEDEEEVPSRAYLKRQAQLVVDAKSRRKNVRIQLPKRN